MGGHLKTAGLDLFNTRMVETCGPDEHVTLVILAAAVIVLFFYNVHVQK